MRLQKIETFGLLNNELKKLKAQCEILSKEIKTEMAENNLNSAEFNNFTAKLTEKTSVTFDDDKLIRVLKAHKIKAVKTVEVVDFEELEKILYSGNIPHEVIEDIDECKIVKKIPTLTVRVKKGEE